MIADNIIKSKHAIIKGNRIELLNERPRVSLFSEWPLDNVTIIRKDDGTIDVLGDQCMYGFVLERLYVDGLSTDEMPASNQLRMGAKTIGDVFTGRRRPYVKGWYRKEKTRPFKATMNHYIIIEP